jgi:phage portal protein BeeE
VNVIASNAARLLIVVRTVRRDNRGEPVSSRSAFVEAMNSRPNDYETAIEFRWRLSALFILNSVGAHVSVKGNVFEILPPGLVVPVPGVRPDGTSTYLDHWRVKVTEKGETVDVPRESILWVRRPHPVDPYSGSTPIQPAGLAIDLDRYARLWVRAMFDDSASTYASTVLLLKGSGDTTSVRERLATAGRGRAAVLTAEDGKVLQLEQSAKEQEIVTVRNTLRDEILAALGVPLSKVSDSSARTFDNADAEDRFFWRGTMGDHLAFIDAPFDAVVGAGEMVGHDTTGVAAIASDDDVSHEQMRIEVVSGLRTPNEYREAVGLGRSSDPLADQLFIPGTTGSAVEGKTMIVAPDGKVAVLEQALAVDALDDLLGSPRKPVPALGG